MLRVRQIYYKPIQLHFNMRDTNDFIPLFNPTSDHLLESGVIARMYQSNDFKDCDYYGVVSHKFYKKIHKTSSYVKQQIEEHPTKPDVFSFFEKNPKLNLVNQGNTWHELFSDIYVRLAKVLKWDIDITNPKHKMEGIYSNHWIAKKEVYEEYCRDYLIPVINALESDKKLKKMIWSDANYISHDRLNAEQCEKIFNRPYYTYHCFILERLFPIFCYMEEKTVVHI